MGQRKKAPPKRQGRYPALKIAAEVEAVRVELEVPAKDAAHTIGVARTAWYKKRDGEHLFSVEDLSLLAEEWDAPPGWPFIPWPAVDLSERRKLRHAKK